MSTTLPRDPETGYIDEIDPPCCLECGGDCSATEELCDNCQRCPRCKHADTIGSNDLCEYCADELRYEIARDWHADNAYRASIGD